MWETARSVEKRDEISVHAIDPLNRQFGLCLTTEGYNDAPFAALVAELREKALKIVFAEQRHQSECTWHEMKIAD